MSVPVVGLTGGIASGKSTVARLFGALGVPVIDADQLAREVVQPGSEGLAEIVRAFGPGVLLSDGTLDRKALGALVFGDSALRAKLNAITHPRIGLLSAERMRTLSEAGPPYLIYEAALIVENGLYLGMHALIVVAVDASTQIARVMERDLLSEDEARARLAAQSPLEKKLAVANHVIENGGSREQLAQRVNEVHERLLESVKVKG